MTLTDTFVKKVKPIKKGGDKYTDGDGMYLLVTPIGKYWRLDYRYLGKRKTLALGVYPSTSLAKARIKRGLAKAQLADGIDPGLVRREDKLRRSEIANQTFATVALTWLGKTENERATTTQEKITGWIEKDLLPYLGPLPITTLKPRDILITVQRIEARGAIESAHRVRQICGQILRFAVASGLVERDVSADLKGALATPQKTNYAAITEPKRVGDLMRAIYGYQGHPYAVAALKLSALLFVRPGELRAAEWDEIDFDKAEWRIPAAKMKMKIEHIVPLSTQALQLLQKLEPMTGHARYVLPSIRTDDRCMSENTVNAALRSMGYTKDEMTAHGFRAMARTILDEVLEERVDLIEHQLAHAVIDPNGRAYNRTAHLAARKQMMQRWADYLDKIR
ncbi:integrase arm-type DNA-binding domain-containing protein [Duganella sp. FT134W]|uniref:Integrase arm-type DNA-binding domain-containing protein n=1 Tax=Duganella margarita TaxID=2692170 RepID=A0A7X4KG39_9BURK|nr:integrase arm-type DNA-binding domain-containing protein [Duganella margarita]MYM71168.1 integrase arm-type DNA-binding domain-containing protein [Duganella margarita]